MGTSPSAYERYTKEEFAQRGDDIYERVVRPRAEPVHNGKFAAIDVETGDYEIDASDLTAIDRLTTRRPGAAVWLRRIGRPYTYRLGRAAAPVAL